VKKAIGQYQSKFQRLSYRVNVEVDRAGMPVTEATVKLSVGDEIMHTVSEGDGPVNALDGALRKALRPFFPNLQQMQLVDYKVRVVNSRAGTAARVRVVIESRDGDAVWGTVGVSENIIEASWLALVDSIEYKLFKDEENGPV
jgi:2-isopropylmalate synthase